MPNPAITPAEALALLLDQVDYTKNACGPTAMVGAVLDQRVIMTCRAALARVGMDEETDRYLVWSNEHRGGWGPGRNGYPQNLAAAGNYFRDEALEICRRAVPGSRHVFNELPVREVDVKAFVENQIIPGGLV